MKQKSIAPTITVLFNALGYKIQFNTFLGGRYFLFYRHKTGRYLKIGKDKCRQWFCGYYSDGWGLCWATHGTFIDMVKGLFKGYKYYAKLKR